jgi:hypothetical protein
MKYQWQRFTVGAVAPTDKTNAFCAEKGHSGLDSKGRCFCCGEQLGQLQPDGSILVPSALALAPTRFAP